MIDMAQAFKDNDKLIDSVYEKYMETKFSPVKNVYFDINCLKDLRMGLMISLSTKDRLDYLRAGLERYNRRPIRNFTFAYPEFPYKEEELQRLYYKDAAKQRDAFNYAPDTVYSMGLPSILRRWRARNDRCNYNLPINVTINFYPFEPGVMVKAYIAILETFFQNFNVKFKAISVHPASISKEDWKRQQVQFFDDFTQVQKDECGWVDACFREQAFMDTEVYAAFCLDPSRLAEWSKTVDWNDLEQVKEQFSPTELTFQVACKFNFTSFGIPTKDNYHASQQRTKGK